MLRSLFVLSFILLAALSACPPPAVSCTSEKCAGCCDAEGLCQTGTTDTACGVNGFTCGACGSGFTCQANVCTSSTSGGGAGGGTGGGSTGGGSGGGATGGSGGAGGGQSGTFTVSGHVTYDFVRATYDLATDTGTLDFARATQRPVRNGVVRVVEGTTVLATTNAAVDGAYTLTFTATSAGPLSVQALAKTSAPAVTVQDNTSSNAIWAIGAPVPAGGGTVDLHATHGWTGSAYGPARTAGPFAILDSMYTAISAFKDVRPALSLPALKVNWSPNNTTDPNGTVAQGFLGTSYFDPDTNQIYVVGKDGEDTDEYDNHVITHEFGHFFESNASRSDSVGGDHSTGDLLDPRDSFSEGWGDAASGILTQDPIYVDTFWSGSTIGAFGWDIENEPTPTDDTGPGPFSEASVMRIIYDAWDTTNEGAWDRLSLGLGPIADAFTGEHKTTSALTTVASFVTGLKAQPSVGAAELDTLAAHSNIGSITTSFGDGDAALRAMYLDVPSFPNTSMVQFNGREAYNFASQNKYWIITGNGARITASATSARDVDIGGYRSGVQVGYSDTGTSGTESFSFNSTAGTVYVIAVGGYGANNANYNVSVVITSP